MAGEREQRLSTELAPTSGPKDHPGEVILALSRAARSFVTYDARNETVRVLIAAYRETTQAALATHGAIVLDVHPFELFWKGAAVYVEQDRERSLAFRLFRDGVRQLTIKPDVPWEELLKLLEILSIRYTGIRQHEDDTLTLLRQAGFRSIEFVVVEAYVPSEEDPEGTGDRRQLTTRAQPPKDWDLPLPRFSSSVQPQYKEIPPEQLAAIRAEDQGEGRVTAATQVVTEALTLALRDPSDDAVMQNALALVEEICKFFIVDLRPKELIWTLRETRAKLGDTPKVQALHDTFAKVELLDRFLRDPEDVAVDALLPLFVLVPGDALEHVIDRFLAEENPQTRRGLKTILARLALGKPDSLLARLGTVPADKVVDLFNVVCVVAPPERAIEAAYSLAEHVSPEVQLGALEVLGGASVTPRFHEVMVRLLAGATPRVRVKTANVYAPRGGSRAYTTLLERFEQLCDTMEPVEAAAFGRGMMLSAKETALPLLRGWLRSGGLGGLVQRLRWGGTGTRMRRWAAVSGLAEDRADRNRELIERMSRHGDAELRKHCEETLARVWPEAAPSSAAPAPPASDGAPDG